MGGFARSLEETKAGLDSYVTSQRKNLWLCVLGVLLMIQGIGWPLPIPYVPGITSVIGIGMIAYYAAEYSRVEKYIMPYMIRNYIKMRDDATK